MVLHCCHVCTVVMLRACFTAGESAGASLNSGLSGSGYVIESIEHGESACEVLSRANFAVHPLHRPLSVSWCCFVHFCPCTTFNVFSPLYVSLARGSNWLGRHCFAEAVQCPEAVHDLVLVCFAEAGHG